MIILKRLTALAAALLLCIFPAAAEGAEGADAASQAVPLGDVTIGYVAPAGSKLNPFLCEERDLVSINSLVYESLFEMDGNMQPQPLLAETWQKDGKTWTINVRSGVTFHNGVELVAQDVVSSFEYFAAAGSKNPYSGRLGLIASIQAVDTFTLEVKAKYPGMITLYGLTFPIVQRDTASSNMPMGTGPYWYVGYQDGVYIRLEANPLWWKRQPETGSVVFRHYWDVGQLLDALQSGEVDMFQTRSTSAALTKKLSYTTSLDYTTATYEMLLPNFSGIMGDANLRKAVMYAIDYNTLITNVYLDMAQQSEVPIPPATWLYEPRSAVYYYSPERALQYLYDSGWSDLTGDAMLNKVENNMLRYVDVNIITYDDATSNVRANAAAQIAENLRSVGINATVQVLSRGKLQEKINEGDYDLALVAVNLSEVPDLSPMFADNGDVNLNNYHTDELDALMVDALSAADETAMKNAYSALQTYIVENLPVMGVCFRTGMILSNRPLAGLTAPRETDVYNGMEFLMN
jgi:peptide/nickel transport system substrate-binding protein